MSDALRRAIRTAAQTFLGMFGVSLLGWFANVQSWAGDTTGHFPSVNPLGKAAAAALAAAASGFVSFLMNKAEDSPNIALPAVLKSEASSGVNPVTEDDAGQVDIIAVCAVAALVLSILCAIGYLPR